MGADEIFKASGLKVPRESAEQFYSKSVAPVRTLQQQYRKQIEESK